MNVVKTFLRRFPVPVMIASLIAWPLAVYFVLRWIQQFPYQLDKAWLLPICLGTTAAVLLIAWFTVGALTWRAASTRPVNSLVRIVSPLRYEQPACSGMNGQLTA